MKLCCFQVFLFVVCLCLPGLAADRPQWGQQYTRNMISAETSLPTTFDPDTGQNFKWSVPLGTETWSTPVVGSGKILIGTNNAKPRDPRLRGDRANLYCFNESDGSFCWQLVVPKIDGDPFKDWPRIGLCSTATIEGDLAYVVTNRNEVVCLDLDGQADGNDGPYTDEGRHMVPEGNDPVEVTKTDADILWLYDIVAERGIYPHDGAHCSILIHGDFLYINTSSGLNERHDAVRVPDQPSLIVVHKKTGKLVAIENEGIGPRIFHSTWSSPALGVINGKERIIFCGGNGVCYAFEPVAEVPPPGQILTLKRVWMYDFDPTAPKENVHQYIRNRETSPSNIKSMPVFHDGRVYITGGGDIWWGKNQAWLKCVDATSTGDITETGHLWSYSADPHCCSTPSVRDGLVFIGDCDGSVHCVDAKTGKGYWSHETGDEIWGSNLVADDKVYVGTRKGTFWVFAAAKEKNLLHTVKLDSPIPSTPVAANGVLYVATMRTLFAFMNQ
ncbi:MAG: PQQ-binding-like beta-propeller repeat protein [Sedimentisphaerales bacterium]|nr:PQQ-binding-like beta-propeller repeat protein [Sedimentisphaerales bacterium]